MATSPGVNIGGTFVAVRIGGIDPRAALDKRNFELACLLAHEKFGAQIGHTMTGDMHDEGPRGIMRDLEIGFASIKPSFTLARPAAAGPIWC